MKSKAAKLSPALATRLANRLGRSVTNPPSLEDLVAALANAKEEATQCAADVSHGAGEVARLQDDTFRTGVNHGDAIDAAVDSSAKAKARGTAIEVDLRGLSKLVDEARERQIVAERAAQRRRHEQTLAEIAECASELDANIDRNFELQSRISTAVVGLRNLSAELGSSDYWMRDFLAGIAGRRMDALLSGRRSDNLSGLSPHGVPSHKDYAAAINAMVRRDQGYDVDDGASDVQQPNEREIA